jgi:hypothetical protein
MLPMQYLLAVQVLRTGNGKLRLYQQQKQSAQNPITEPAYRFFGTTGRLPSGS